MFSVEKICESAVDTKQLDSFVKNNISLFSQFFDSDINHLSDQKWEIEDCVIENEISIEALDFSLYYNSLFILTLLNYFERFSLQGGYNILYNIATEKGLQLGYRQRATRIYLLDTIVREDHIKNLPNILEYLQNAYETEEDDEKSVLTTFGNYYLNMVLNTFSVDESITKRIVEFVRETRKEYSFLSFRFVDNLLSLSINTETDYEELIRSLINNLYAKSFLESNSEEHFFIEKNTDYIEELKEISTNYIDIRSVSMEMYNSYTSERKIELRNELLRGVKIIDKEEQLYAYFTLYGEKHRKKLKRVFSKVIITESKYNIIDWACGQGLASMAFIDNFGKEKVEKVILNEPSVFSLKRASLHLKKYLQNDSSIKTINKAIEQIEDKDIVMNNNKTNIHLFSNILDVKIDLFHLIKIIIEGSKGKSYFFCVSPYIDDERTNRIDLFVDYFRTNFSNSFKMMYNKDIQNANPTMVARVFSVEIPQLEYQ